MTILRIAKYFWASPTTLIGLSITAVTVLTRGRFRIVNGVLETHGGFTTLLLKRLTPLPGGAAAMTLGHVVLGQDLPMLEATRLHERVHVRQCERWGPLFVPAYLSASFVLWVMRRDPYRDNPFEREAYAVAP